VKHYACRSGLNCSHRSELKRQNVRSRHGFKSLAGKTRRVRAGAVPRIYPQHQPKVLYPCRLASRIEGPLSQLQG